MTPAAMLGSVNSNPVTIPSICSVVSYLIEHMSVAGLIIQYK